VVCGGDLFIAGRRRDMVIVNGQNYFPEDIEAAAAEVEGIFRRHVVAVADAERERMLVVVEAVRSADARELGAAVRRRVAERTGVGAVEVRVVAPRWLPRTTSGKWQRAAVRQLLGERSPAGGAAAPGDESASAAVEAQSDTRKETLR
ncbi:fatty acyl-AMP ligase, partial [Streptomyces sp. A7024]|nr:fatty acyl-AMP ligase [Streptomyces coryli]